MIPFHHAPPLPTPRPRPTTLLLIRHAVTDDVGVRLTGRAPGVRLNDRGRAQVRALCGQLRHVHLHAICSSPMARAVETAAPLALARRLPIRIVPDLDEVDFGDWTGLSFAQLDGRSDWAEYNNSRDTAGVPRGESADMVCTRITRALESLRQQCRGGIVAAVTHAEIIRYAVLLTRYVPIREWQEIDVKPASIASIQWDDELHNHDRDGNTLPESLGPAVVVLDGDRDGSLPANPR